MQDYVEEALHELLTTLSGVAAISVRTHDHERLGRALQETAAVACMAMDLGTLVNLLLLADDVHLLQQVRWPHVEHGPKLSARTGTAVVAAALLAAGERRQEEALREAGFVESDEPVLAAAARHLAAAALAFGNRPGCRKLLTAARLLERTAVPS